MATDSLTEQLKCQLWKWYGSNEILAEWDGHVHGGGKISQRFWEYHAAVDMLDLHEGDVILDIGGGSPTVGLSIFPLLLARFGIKVIVVDVNFGSLQSGDVTNVWLERGYADYDLLCRAFETYKPTHLSSVSVLEHATEEQQKGIFDAVETAFTGDIMAFTFEFHETTRFFEIQPTVKTLSNAVSGLTRYYVSRMERCPMNCVNAFDGATRLWYPMALQFRKNV